MVHENLNNNGGEEEAIEEEEEEEEVDSGCSTPYVSAPSSPSRGQSRCFFSAPASPMHFAEQSGSFEFEFEFEFESTARHSDGSGWMGGSSMSSADELFLNGQIRPMENIDKTMERLNLLKNDDEGDEEVVEQELGYSTTSVGSSSRSGRDVHRRTRSLSPLRNSQSFEMENMMINNSSKQQSEQEAITSSSSSSSVSSSSLSSSSSSSWRWVLLKDLLRSKSEGRANANAKERFWYAMAAKDKKSSKSFKDKTNKSAPNESVQQRLKSKSGSGGGGGGGKRRLSPHEMHYTANRAQSEEMRKRTFLPYRQGLLGCLGFTSKSYGAMNGFATPFNPLSST